MTERVRESLSAMMDDEAGELEFRRVLSQIAEDEELRRTWLRYNVARAAVTGHSLEYLNLDVSQRVRDALAEEADAGPGSGAGGSVRERLLRPLSSFALAASVTVTVVIGGQQLAQLQGARDEAARTAAGSASPVGLVNSLGATPVRASYGTQPLPVLQPATRTAYQELARQRMQQYAQQHAEQAALNSPSGLMLFARVPQIRE